MRNYTISLVFIIGILTSAKSQSINPFMMNPTRSASYPYYNVYGAGYNECTGPVNMIINGNLNFNKYPSSSSSSCSLFSYAYNSMGNYPRWTSSVRSPLGIPPIFNASFSGSFGSTNVPDIKWPYSIKWYCDASSFNFSYNYFAAYGGIMQVDILKDHNVRNYFIVKLTRPLTNGRKYIFEMEIDPFKTLDSTMVGIDQIGVYFTDSIPVSTTPISLEYITPQIKTKKDSIVSSTYILSDTIVGGGETYAIIGVFEPYDSLLFSNQPDTNSFTSRYNFDNLKLYDPLCPNGHIYFNFPEDTLRECVNSSKTVNVSYGKYPYTWYIDGIIQSDTSNSISVIADSNSKQIIVTSGTGVCIDTAKIILVGAYANIILPDTMYQLCDSLVKFKPVFQYYNISTGGGSYIWYNVDSTVSSFSYSTGVYSTVDTGKYIIHHQFETCFTNDTVQLINEGNIPFQDSLGNQILIKNINDEHCINMNDGSIEYTPVNYNSTIHINWLTTSSYDTLRVDSLSQGLINYVVYDDAHRCTIFADTIKLLLDSCGIIEGIVYNDLNANCIKDSSDIYLPNVSLVSNPVGNIGVTDSLGHFQIFVPPGVYNVDRNYSTPYTGNLCASNTTNLSLSSGTIISNADFADTIHSFNHDIELVSIYNNMFKLASYSPIGIQVTIKNNGDTIIDGILKLLVTHPAVQFNYAFINNYVGSVGDTLMVQVLNMLPGQTRTIDFPFLIPFNNNYLGDIVYVKGWVSTTNENNLSNNYGYWSDIIVSAYDPNDKTGFPIGAPNTTLVDTSKRTFVYAIRFQNTGNSVAQNIVIRDSISNLFDLSSLEIIKSSHFVQTYSYNNVVNFNFPNIMLSDSNANEPESHGYVIFKINTKPNASIGDSLINTAYIYFDNNPPIKTNNTFNLYGNTTVLSNIYYNGCVNDSLLYNNNYYYNDSLFTDSLYTTFGYDSIVFSHLIFHNSTSQLVNSWICVGDSINFNGTNYFNSGIYNDTLNTLYGCDSIITLDLNFYSNDSLITYNNGVLNYPNNVGSIQWLLNGVPINGANNINFTPVVNGVYSASIVDNNGCNFNTIELFVGIVGIEEDKQLFRLLPNPVKDYTWLTINPIYINKSFLKLYNSIGELEQTIEINNSKIKINMKDYPKGTYFIEFLSNNIKEVRKIIKL